MNRPTTHRAIVGWPARNSFSTWEKNIVGLADGGNGRGPKPSVIKRRQIMKRSNCIAVEGGIVASVFGDRSASFLIIAPVVGVRELKRKSSSATLAGSTMSPAVIAGPSPL